MSLQSFENIKGQIEFLEKIGRNIHIDINVYENTGTDYEEYWKNQKDFFDKHPIMYNYLFEREYRKALSLPPTRQRFNTYLKEYMESELFRYSCDFLYGGQSKEAPYYEVTLKRFLQ